MNTILHKAGTRGHANHGWLNSYHTFSFAGYHDADRIHFGALRVLNDDTVSGGMGFGAHPHDNMEIISIPTKGDLEHQDNMGNKQVIRQGDVQVMSAGTGIQHSEKTRTRIRPLNFSRSGYFPISEMFSPGMISKVLPMQTSITNCSPWSPHGHHRWQSPYPPGCLVQSR